MIHAFRVFSREVQERKDQGRLQTLLPRRPRFPRLPLERGGQQSADGPLRGGFLVWGLRGPKPLEIAPPGLRPSPFPTEFSGEATNSREALGSSPSDSQPGALALGLKLSRARSQTVPWAGRPVPPGKRGAHRPPSPTHSPTHLPATHVRALRKKQLPCNDCVFKNGLKPTPPLLPSSLWAVRLGRARLQ